MTEKTPEEISNQGDLERAPSCLISPDDGQKQQRQAVPEIKKALCHKASKCRGALSKQWHVIF